MSLHEFSDPGTLATALADKVESALRNRLMRDGKAALAVSGGTTPLKFFENLAQRDLDWANVTITLVDDRWVSASSPRSNAKVVRDFMLHGPASAATFIPLVTAHDTPEAGRDEIEAAIKSLPLPFAAVVLGMGKDGHTASLFPAGDRLTEALAPVSGRLVETMRAEAALEPRITLTLPVLLAADLVALHIEGERKRAVLHAAQIPGAAQEYPIRAVLARSPAPEIFWCP